MSFTMPSGYGGMLAEHKVLTPSFYATSTPTRGLSVLELLRKYFLPNIHPLLLLTRQRLSRVLKRLGQNIS